MYKRKLSPAQMDVLADRLNYKRGYDHPGAESYYLTTTCDECHEVKVCFQHGAAHGGFLVLCLDCNKPSLKFRIRRWWVRFKLRIRYIV